MLAIDIGDENIKLARWKKSKNQSVVDSAEIVHNDMSKKMTPAHIAFKKQRIEICDHARKGVYNNFNNYISDIKKTIGSSSLLDNVEEDIKTEKLKSNILVEDDLVSYKVQYNNESVSVTSEHVLSIMLEYCYYLFARTSGDGYEDLKNVAKRCNDSSNVVITIPSYYTNAHVSGMQMALDANNFKSVHFIRDYVASALEYGYYRNSTNEFDASPRVVLFVDMSALSTTATLVRYSKNTMEVLATDYVMIGGKDMDIPVRKTLREIYERELDVSIDDYSESDRARQLFILNQKAKSIKEDFASPDIDDLVCEVEDLPTDDDVELEIERDDYFEGCEELFETLEEFITTFLKKNATTIHNCEMVSGASRMLRLHAIVKKAIAEYGCSKISSTLLLDECVVRGACMAEALLTEGKLAIATHTTPFEYTNYQQEKRHHDLVILGCGETPATSDKYTVINTVDTFKDQDSKPHNWEKLSKKMHECKVLFEGVEEASNVWMTARGKATNEVLDALDSLPDDYPNHDAIKAKLEEFHLYLQRLPIQGTDALIEEVKAKTQEVHNIAILYKKNWLDIGLNKPCWICYNYNAPLTGKFDFYRDSKLEDAFGFCVLKAGVFDGEYEEMDEKGQVVEKRFYKDNKPVYRYSFQDGQLRFVRLYDKLGYLEKLISFYNASRIEHLRDFSRSSRLRVYYSPYGLIKRIVVKKKKKDLAVMFEYNYKGLLLYEGPFEMSKEHAKKEYIRSGVGMLFHGNKFYVKGTFINQGNTIQVEREEQIRDYPVKELFKVKVEETEKERVKPWKIMHEREDKENGLYYVRCHNSIHKRYEWIDEADKVYKYSYGLCNMCLEEQEVRSKNMRLIYPMQTRHWDPKLCRYYPEYMYWDEKDEKHYSNITKSIADQFGLHGYVVVNENICKRNNIN